jgi:16S rRNA (guanine966-N2)-methyltransferase
LRECAALRLGGIGRIFRRVTTRLGSLHPLEPFSLLLLDPPYGKGLAEGARLCPRWRLAGAGALIVVEGRRTLPHGARRL